MRHVLQYPVLASHHLARSDRRRFDVLNRFGTEGEFERLFINLQTKQRLTAVNKVWGRLRVKTGLAHLRLHHLRHQFASSLANAGHMIYEVQKILGHSDTEVAERYAHLSLNTLQAAANSTSMKMRGAYKVWIVMPEVFEAAWAG